MAQGSLPPHYADSGIAVNNKPNPQQRMVETHVPLKASMQGYDSGSVGTGGTTAITSGPGTSKVLPLKKSFQGYGSK